MPRPSPRAALTAFPLIAFCSGIAGLIYEVIWIREFGNIFGNTIESASLVTAVFMCGLGVGSVLTGLYCDRSARGSARATEKLLGFYAKLELGIALFGLAIALALPRLEFLSGFISSYTRDPETGWLRLSFRAHAVRYVLALALLGPPTLLMGGTLPVLAKIVVKTDVALAGWRIGWVYAVNTLGAMVGCVAADLVLIPALGLYGAQGAAVLCNLGAALAASNLARRGGRGAGVERSLSASSQKSASARDVRGLWLVCGAIFCAGLLGMGLEILWFRYLVSILSAQRTALSLLLAMILGCLAVGAWLGGHLQKRYGRPELYWMLAQTFLMLTAMAFLATAPSLVALNAGDPASWRWNTVLLCGRMLSSILWLVGLPALLMGFSFPLANACVQKSAARVGVNTGVLYLANTLGGVVGSLVTGFLLLPQLGMQASVLPLMGVGFLGLLLTHLSAPRPKSKAAFPCLGAVALAVLGFHALPSGLLLSKIYHEPEPDGGHYLAIHEGLTETVAVVERDSHDGKSRSLMTNGHSMSDNSLDSQRYMRMFSHLPLLQLESPKDVLVICFGVGNTLHAASLHPSVEHLEVADLSRNILSFAPFFNKTNHDVLKDPRVSVFVNDGRQHLRAQPPERYDLITLEPPPPSFAGVASLYSEEFYRLAQSRLKPGGYVTQWLSHHAVPGVVLRSMMRAFQNVFPDSMLVSGLVGDLILMGRKGGLIELDPAALERRLKARPEVRKDLERISVESLRALIGAYVGDGALIDQIAGDAPPVTDDWPIMEYSLGSLFVRPWPGHFLQMSDIAQLCPKCFAGGKPIAGLEGLDVYSALVEQTYQLRQIRPSDLPFSPQRVSEAMKSNAYLRRFFGL